MEDGGCLAECIAGARKKEDFPEVLKVFESVRKGRAEKMKLAALASGMFKGMKNGDKQRKRDKGFRERMDEKNEKYDFWRASGSLSWIYAYDVIQDVS